MSMRQTVEADVSRLRKLLDDTNIIRLHLESDIESLKEELITLRKNHKTVREAPFVRNNLYDNNQPNPTKRCSSKSKIENQFDKPNTTVKRIVNTHHCGNQFVS